MKLLLICLLVILIRLVNWSMFISEHVRVLALSVDLLLIIWVDVRLPHLLSLGVCIWLLLSYSTGIGVRRILLGHYPRVGVRSLEIRNTCSASLVVLILAWIIGGKLSTWTLFWLLLENILLPVLQLIGLLVKLLWLSNNLWLKVCLSVWYHLLMLLIKSIRSIRLPVWKSFLHVIVLPTWNNFLMLEVLLSIWDHIRLVIILLLIENHLLHLLLWELIEMIWLAILKLHALHTLSILRLINGLRAWVYDRLLLTTHHFLELFRLRSF
jgi:hypothetical protein